MRLLQRGEREEELVVFAVVERFTELGENGEFVDHLDDFGGVDYLRVFV